MFWIPILAGAAIGAMTHKKPLQGALMGGALGATGGGLLGAAGAAGATGAAGAGAGAIGGAGATAGATAPGLLGAEAAAGGANWANGAMGAVPDGSSFVADAAPGTMDQLFAGVKKYQPLFNAAQTGMSAANSLGQPEQEHKPANFAFGSQTGPQSLASIATQGGHGILDRMGEAERKREQRKLMLRGLLG